MKLKLSHGAAPGRTLALAIVLAYASLQPASAAWSAAEAIDLDAVYRLKDEGLQRSQVMDLAQSLTDVYGPRVTGSPNLRAASDWAMRKMNEWGLANVHAESWPFGRGWQNDHVVASAESPQAYPLIAYPKAWTPGTDGAVTAEAVLAVIQNDQDFDKFRGTLRGRFVLSVPIRAVQAHFEAQGRRLTDTELNALTLQPPAAGRGVPPPQDGAAFNRRKMQFWIDEGVAAVLDCSPGDGGTVFVQAGGSRDPKDPPAAPQITLAVEHYNRIARTLEKKIPVTLRMDVKNSFFDADQNAANIVGELSGADKADETVMIGAHLDSWHTGTGATDNAAGSAVMLEAMRILKTTGVKLRRTVRVALWTGEEQGLLGSRAYVKAHFGDPATMQLRPEHGAFDVYFNVDNGTGQIRGVYQQGNEGVAPIFSSWMEPLRSLGMSTLTIRGTGGTDHLSFDAVGLPGFQFLQDPIEYNPRTHHSNMDTFERLQPDDMMRNAVIVASFAYHAANRDEPLPRKPLPKVTPPSRP